MNDERRITPHPGAELDSYPRDGERIPGTSSPNVPARSARAFQGAQRQTLRSFTSGHDERHLARGALIQQVSQGLGTLIALAVITVLGRTLTLSQFGAYGLIVGTTSYLLIVQGSVETAAVRAIARARDQDERDQVFSNAIVLYLGAGLLAGSIVAAGGWFVVGVLNIPPRLQFDARVAVAILGALMLLGWPMQVFQDLLRGTQRFVAAAVAEMIALTVFGGAMIASVITGMPLWLLIGLGGSLPVLTGFASVAAAQPALRRFRFRRASVGNAFMRELAGTSGYLLIGNASVLIIYALDRFLLAAFRGIVFVGLYEGPARIHNFVESVQSALVGPVLPAAAQYEARSDDQRLRELMLRGTRYVLVVTIPIIITLMVFSKPLLVLWLGRKFGVAALSTTILLSYVLVTVNQVVPGSMLVATGRVGWLSRYAWTVAIFNVAASLVLTWQYGLNGVVLGTTIPFVLAFPIFLRKAVSVLPFSVASLLRTAWIPAYSTGVIVGCVLVAVRVLVPIDNLPELVSLLIGGPLLYWGLFFVTWTTSSERALLGDLLRVLFQRLSHPLQDPTDGRES